ncbi:hypothetical protein AAFF_G00190050 [Aldrovandia affinis]|uniref:Uncharacterized protein n=1 Tax=Aldrovandia affinis TaxID=143900 RepID=A0AAD7RJI3_9TELE|nr:hypothetical protein AAFF_G00190050 [Aldrovandia affinis]
MPKRSGLLLTHGHKITTAKGFSTRWWLTPTRGDHEMTGRRETPGVPDVKHAEQCHRCRSGSTGRGRGHGGGGNQSSKNNGGVIIVKSWGILLETAQTSVQEVTGH